MKQGRQPDGKAFYFLSIAILTIIIDRLTKQIILSTRGKIAIIENLVYLAKSANTGAAFSIFQGQNRTLLFISLIVVGAILYYYQKIPAKKLPLTAAALIVGGAIGNIIDRAFYGYVIDFVYISFWPSFNVADSAITIGGVLLAAWILRKG